MGARDIVTLPASYSCSESVFYSAYPPVIARNVLCDEAISHFAGGDCFAPQALLAIPTGTPVPGV